MRLENWEYRFLCSTKMLETAAFNRSAYLLGG